MAADLPTSVRCRSKSVWSARTHGSALFQRGETQVLNITTLGMLKMEQMLDTLAPEDSKRYMHHYNMPPFSVGEAGFMRGPKRREIGHGALAEKALLPVDPDRGGLPLRASAWSPRSSRRTARPRWPRSAGSSLSLMDAGVPISDPVAGIAMGLIERDGKYVTLTDILGAEDALGDMDFKVAGTADVITALQLDTKLQGLPVGGADRSARPGPDGPALHPRSDEQGHRRPPHRAQQVGAADRDRSRSPRTRSVRSSVPRARSSASWKRRPAPPSRSRKRAVTASSGSPPPTARLWPRPRSGSCHRVPAGGRVGQGVRRRGRQHHQVRRLRQHPAGPGWPAPHLQARRHASSRTSRGLPRAWARRCGAVSKRSIAQGKLALKLVDPLERKEGAGPRSPAMIVLRARPWGRSGRPTETEGDRGGDRGDRRPAAADGGNRDRGPRPDRRPAEPVQPAKVGARPSPSRTSSTTSPSPKEPRTQGSSPGRRITGR